MTLKTQRTVERYLVGWAKREEEWYWRYRCPLHPPGSALWTMIHWGEWMDQGPSGMEVKLFPPLCEVCHADLRDLANAIHP